MLARRALQARQGAGCAVSECLKVIAVACSSPFVGGRQAVWQSQPATGSTSQRL